MPKSSSDLADERMAWLFRFSRYKGKALKHGFPDGERAEKVEKNDIGICLSETIRKKGSRYDEEIDGNICAIYFSG